jgi:hypothetical protein
MQGQLKIQRGCAPAASPEAARFIVHLYSCLLSSQVDDQAIEQFLSVFLPSQFDKSLRLMHMV